MFPNLNPWLALFSAFVVALVVCNRMTPPVNGHLPFSKGR